jgi:shikimate kinase
VIYSGPSILLVGLMGTGKSTVARQLALHFGIDSLDTDRMIESRTHQTVREIFAQSGENAFRDLESEVLQECLERQIPCVIAGAGGVVVRESNRELINSCRTLGRVIVVWLHALPNVLAVRTSKGAHRPLLDEDREGTLVRLANEREPMYASVSDIIVDVSQRSVEATVNLLVEAIVEDLNERSQSDE